MGRPMHSINPDCRASWEGLVADACCLLNVFRLNQVLLPIVRCQEKFQTHDIVCSCSKPHWLL